MGLHVSVMDAKYRDHKRWDCVRHGGDRDLVEIIDAVPTIRIDTPSKWEPEPPVLRPVDLVDFRRRLRERFGNMNYERWELLCDILESDPGVGIHFGF